MNVKIVYTNNNPKPDVFIDGEQGKLIKHGVRYVYKFSKYFLKLDNNGDHHCSIYDHTQTEINFFLKEIKQEDKKYFVPIIKHGKCEKGRYWAVQPKHDCRAGRKSYRDKKIISEISEKYDLIDVGGEFPRNWNYYKGIPAIYDYGL